MYPCPEEERGGGSRASIEKGELSTPTDRSQSEVKGKGTIFYGGKKKGNGFRRGKTDPEGRGRLHGCQGEKSPATVSVEKKRKGKNLAQEGKRRNKQILSVREGKKERESNLQRGLQEPRNGTSGRKSLRSA